MFTELAMVSTALGSNDVQRSTAVWTAYADFLTLSIQPRSLSKNRSLPMAEPVASSLIRAWCKTRLWTFTGTPERNLNWLTMASQSIAFGQTVRSDEGAAKR